MKRAIVGAILLLAASVCHSQTNARPITPAQQTKPASQKVKRVRIPTYLAESMTRRIVLPRDIGISGEALLEILVEKDGRVLNVRRVSGDARLFRTANPAMMKWVFIPFFLNGEPVQFLTELTIQFDGKKGSAKLKIEPDPLAAHTPKAR